MNEEGGNTCMTRVTRTAVASFRGLLYTWQGRGADYRTNSPSGKFINFSRVRKSRKPESACRARLPRLLSLFSAVGATCGVVLGLAGCEVGTLAKTRAVGLLDCSVCIRFRFLDFRQTDRTGAQVRQQPPRGSDTSAGEPPTQ